MTDEKNFFILQTISSGFGLCKNIFVNFSTPGKYQIVRFETECDIAQHVLL